MKNILPFPVVPGYALFRKELEQEALIWQAIKDERLYGPMALKVAQQLRELEPVIFAPVIKAIAIEDTEAAYLAVDDIVFEAIIKTAKARIQQKGGPK